ncbi:MAG: DNA-binding protein [Saprospiraceae bacterium]
MSRTYTESEAIGLIVQALEIFQAREPKPTHVTNLQAAQMLNLSPRTVSSLKLKRNKANKIPYEEVIAARSAR